MDGLSDPGSRAGIGKNGNYLMADFSNESVIKEFRDNGGKVGGYFEGLPLLLLTTTGAKSGKTYMSPDDLSRGRWPDPCVRIKNPALLSVPAGSTIW